VQCRGPAERAVYGDRQPISGVLDIGMLRLQGMGDLLCEAFRVVHRQRIEDGVQTRRAGT
jgi:hypothetical protein